MNSVYMRYEYSFMIVMSLLTIIVLMLLNYNLIFINNLYAIIIYWSLSILFMNLKIIYRKLNGLLLVVPLSLAIPETMLYFNLIDSKIILGLSYLLLMTYTFYIGRLSVFDMNRNMFDDRKPMFLSIFLISIILGLVFLTGLISSVKELGLTNLIFFTIAGPLVEGTLLLFTVSSEYRKIMAYDQLHGIVVLANTLFISLAVSLNIFLMVISILGNSLKALLNFKVGTLLDYAIRIGVLASILMGVNIYA